MHALAVSDLLRVWESGLDQLPVERALSLLAAACPEAPLSVLSKLTIGQRDSRLLTLREWTFGPQLESVTACPRCDRRVELRFDVSSLRIESESRSPETVALDLEDFHLQVRCPNSEDVAALAVEADPEQKRRILFQRCLVLASRNGEPTSLDEPLPEILDTVANRLAEADPQADVQLDICCPFCGKAWQAAFDIFHFFWNEIEAWACRMLQQVHTLASAYGWTENEVLALSPTRRQLYFEMVNA